MTLPALNFDRPKIALRRLDKWIERECPIHALAQAASCRLAVKEYELNRGRLGAGNSLVNALCQLKTLREMLLRPERRGI
jgi:hypothetical protein